MFDFASTISRLLSVAARKGHPATISRSSPRSAKSPSAAPAPYQPGSMIRACAQLNTQGMARKSSIASDVVRDAGREPILSSAISVIGVAARKKALKPGVP